MELQTLLALCGFGVVSVAMLMLMSLFKTSGTSYEEAVAMQRKVNKDLKTLTAPDKAKPKKKEKKAIKKQAKKEKSKESASRQGSELESEAPAESGVEDDSVPAARGHVEFSPTVVVDAPRDTPPNVKIRKRGKDPKVKPILVNKEDPSCVSNPASVPEATATTATNHFEEMHPKDEFELMHPTLTAEKAAEKSEEVVEKKEKPAKPAKSGKSTAKTAAPAVEAAKEEAARERPNNGDAPKEQRKGKKSEKKAPVEEVIEVVREELVPPLNAPQPSELTTEKLLKQALAVAPPLPTAAPSPPGGKKKKKAEPNVLSLMAGDSSGVNVAELVRVVREAALSRNEIQILTDALLNKHHDPLPEHSEWSEGPNDPMQKLKRQLADKEKALADEVEASQALQAKLKELRSQLNAERTRASTTVRTSEQAVTAARSELHGLQSRLQMVVEDNKQLTQEKMMLQSKLGVDNEAHAQMEIHIQRLSDSEQGLLGQLAALQAELAAHAHESGTLRLELGAVRDSLCLAQAHVGELSQQLGEANRAYAELDQQRVVLQHAEQRVAQELRQANERIAAMGELQNEVQRLGNRAQNAESQLDKVREESDKELQQLTSELAKLGEQLSQSEAELAELRQLKAVPAQNGLPANDQLKSAELAKVESVVEALRGELNGAQSTAKELRENVAQLQTQLATYQEKNNDLRTKNWKVMEALQSAEKALHTKTSSALPARESQDSLHEAIAKAQEAQYKEVASVLREACPAAAPNSTADLTWVQTFAGKLKEELAKALVASESASADTAAIQERLKDLQLQNEQSQALVEKYKNVIANTEEAVNRLQETVASQEKKWAKQLADKQRELDELRQNTVPKDAVTKAQVTRYELEANILRRVCPAATPDIPVGENWLKAFANNLKEELSTSDTEERMEDLQLQNEKSLALVEKYKSVIRNTEETLSRLQQTVSQQEQTWAQQLAEKQRELDELRQHTVNQMQSKIDTLHVELQQAKASSHNHTFADAERQAEERLMAASISDKHNIDVRNGPLQVGLEEK